VELEAVPGPAVQFAVDPLLAVEVVEHGHHGGVGQIPALVELLEYFLDLERSEGSPEHGHHRGYEITETSHHASYFSAIVREPFSDGRAYLVGGAET
jgi:hypothetical protein